MNESQFTPQEMDLITQLRRSAAPEMKSEAVESLRQRMFDEVDIIWTGAQPEAPTAPARRGMRLLPLVALFIVLASLAVIFALSRLPDETPIEEEIFTTETPTAALTATPTITQTTTPTHTASATPTATQTASPIATATIAPTSSPVPPSPQPATALPAIDAADDVIESVPLVIIEGPVTTISEHHVTIFDQLVEIDSVQDVAAQLEVNMRIRVRGEARFESSGLVIRAAVITIIRPPASVPTAPPPSSGGRGSGSSRSS